MCEPILVANFKADSEDRSLRGAFVAFFAATFFPRADLPVFAIFAPRNVLPK